MTTENTTATVLQGFTHESDTLGVSDRWALVRTAATITLLPGQNITAHMRDDVTVLE